MFEGQSINLQIWDIAWQEDYKKLRPFSYPQTDVFIICFSLISQESLDNVERLWLPEIKEHCPDVPYILIGTQSSFRDDFHAHSAEFKSKGWTCVSKEKGEEMKRKIGANDYIECDSFKQIHIKEVFEAATKAALHPQEKKGENQKKSFLKKFLKGIKSLKKKNLMNLINLMMMIMILEKQPFLR